MTCPPEACSRASSTRAMALRDVSGVLQLAVPEPGTTSGNRHNCMIGLRDVATITITGKRHG